MYNSSNTIEISQGDKKIKYTTYLPLNVSNLSNLTQYDFISRAVLDALFKFDEECYKIREQNTLLQAAIYSHSNGHEIFNRYREMENANKRKNQ